MLRKLFFTIILISNDAFATQSQCIKNIDWKKFCERPDAPGIRCLLVPDSGATDFCAEGTEGCAAAGGCFGDVPPGWYYPIMENHVNYKCRCGCVAAPLTALETSVGKMYGKDLFLQKDDSSILVATINSIDNLSSSSFKKINGIMAAKSYEKSLSILTQSGRSVVLSPGHPVLTTAPNGSITMKKASDIHAGEQVMNSEGDPDEVVRVSEIDYADALMNFNVMSDNPVEHIVPMNGILLGDSAWQERLSSRDARILLRTEIALELMKGKNI